MMCLMDAIEPAHPASVRVSRRRFVQFAGVGSIVAVLDGANWLGGMASSLELDGNVLTTTLIRPDDQLRLQLEFLNVVHDRANNRLQAGPTGTPMMRVLLPRQHVSEQPVPAAPTPPTVPPGASASPIPHAAAANSRLVFEISAPIDLTVEALLDLAAHTLTTTALKGNPDDETTMIELPADLRWSPAANVSATADLVPKTSGNVSQLHRIKLNGPQGPVDFTPVHNALSADDAFGGRIPNRGSRDSIVDAATTEGPATAQRVWLTPHGAWADLEGEWSTVEWTQRVQGGRDQFVQVVEKGILMPFGLPAVWTETATRLWLVDADGAVVSTMVSETHFAVTGEATVDLHGPSAPAAGRRMPFEQVTIEAKDNIAAVKRPIDWSGSPGPVDDNDAWVVTYGGDALWAGTDVRVSYRGLDRLGEETQFSLAALFVRTEALDDQNLRNGLAAFYASDEGDTFRRRTMLSNIAWAEPVVEGVGTTTQFTVELEFALEPTVASNPGELPIQPVVSRGIVRSADAGGDIGVTFNVAYLLAGNSEALNPTLAYLDLDEATPFPLGTEARAVMTPDLLAEEFNQNLGIGPAPQDNAGTDTWDPAVAFGEGASILRGVKLSDIVGPISFDAAVPGIDIPTFESLVLDDRIVQSYIWCPDSINSFPDAGFVTTPDTQFCIEVSSTIALDSAVQAGTEVEFRVSDFQLVVPPILGAVILDVAELRAIQPADGPVDLTLDIEDWTLGGALSFLEVLFKQITPSGSAFDLDIDSDTITAVLDVPLPNINLGVLVIKNFAIGLTGTFPYAGDGEPSVAIAVGTKRNPVDIQILQFGGGFRMELALDAGGLQSLEIYAEVSARLVEIDIKIATAYCEVGVSAEFSLDSNGDVTFKGSLWMEASFNVLGLVGATLRITGSVKYKEANERLRFSGTIHWSVTALFTFSGKVPIGSITFELGDGQASSFAGRSLRGGGGHLAQAAPSGGTGGSFGDVHSLASWTDYVKKFA